MLIILYIMIALICAVVSYGITFAYFQREFPNIASKDYSRDKQRAVFFGFGALVIPILLVLYFFLSEKMKHGLKFR